MKLKIIIMLLTIAVCFGILCSTAEAAPKCPCCETYKNTHCVYWCDDRHMTPNEIQDFEIMEMGYSDIAVKRMSQTEKNQLTPWFKLTKTKAKVKTKTKAKAKSKKKRYKYNRLHRFWKYILLSIFAK